MVVDRQAQLADLAVLVQLLWEGVSGDVAERHQSTRSAAVWRTVEFSHWMLDLLLAWPSEGRFREGLRDARLARLMSGGRFANEFAAATSDRRLSR